MWNSTINRLKCTLDPYSKLNALLGGGSREENTIRLYIAMGIIQYFDGVNIV